MNKKNVILIGAVVCAVIGAGIFYWNYLENQSNLPSQQSQEPEMTGSPDDYAVIEQEQEQGRFVENKRAGLKVRIPDNWTEEKMDVMEGSMVFYSPDAESMHKGRIRPPLNKGCMIEIAIVYKKTNLDEVKKDTEEDHEFLIMESDDKFETIEVSGRPALKDTFDCMDLGHSIEVYTLTENILYGLRISSSPEDIEKCSQEFDEFLEGVVINN